MKLKNILYSSAVVAVAALFTACSDIDENERFEYVKPASVNRAVLIEDFTGRTVFTALTELKSSKVSSSSMARITSSLLVCTADRSDSRAARNM